MDHFENRPFKILIVDDIPKNIQLAATIFQNEGYQMAFAQNGAAALSLARSHEFDLILLDIMMPDMDGFEVCEKLKSDPVTRDIPVIFITAKNDTDSIVRGLKTGGADYVTKPFRGAELLARARTHLELNYSRRELIHINKQLNKENEQRRKAEDELKRSEEKYRDQAVHDNLTELYNTRFLYQVLPSLISESESNSTPFSLIFMDIDNFKNVVDTYGHLNGSLALQEVAATIRDTLENPAFAVAYGGDEFVTVLPGFDKDKAVQKAEEIRERMSKTVYLSCKGHHVSLKASFGVSTCPDDAVDMTQLLTFADRAMFDIKERGKDAVGDHGEKQE